MCDLCKSSADLVLTSCSGQRNELISSFVIVYVYHVKCVVYGMLNVALFDLFTLLFYLF